MLARPLTIRRRRHTLALKREIAEARRHVRHDDVFSMHPLRGRSDWYYEQVASGREDYYAERDGGGDAAGAWVGAAAADLGLQGEVEAGQLGRMSDGVHPATGRQLLTRRIRATRWRRRSASGRLVNAEPVGGYDLTFSAPKSVSVLFAVGDTGVRRDVRDCHDAAVRDALGYLEREACVTRRGTKGRRRLRGEGFVGAAYRHVASRARDPQVHTHVVVANMTRAEGRWTRLDGASLFRHGKTAGYLYQASLRWHLTDRLGVAWEAVENGHAEVAGIPKGVIAEFSRRRAAIEEELKRRGLSGPRAAQVAALDTRERKDLAVATERLHDEWRARAAEHGLARSALADLTHVTTVESPSTPALAAVGRRLGGADGLTQRSPTFDRRLVLQAWAIAVVQARPGELEALADAWLRSPRAVRLEADPGPGQPGRFSTPEMMAIERRLLCDVRARRSGRYAKASTDAVKAALAARPTSTEEQMDLVRAVCSSGSGVDIVRGLAGSGKTFALAATRDAFERDGFAVQSCALQGKAALLLEREAGIPSRTIAQLLIDLRLGERLDSRTVLVVDEAGMVGTRHLAEITDHAGRGGAKIVLIGDDGQLPELDAGGAFGHLARRHRTAELRRIVRQRDRRDVDALALLRQGQAAAAMRAMRERGRLVVADDADETRAAIIAAWRAAFDRPGPGVMLARRHRDVAELNDLARAALRAEGRLPIGVSIGDREFAIGDRVIAGRNDRRLNIRNGMLGTIHAIDCDQRHIRIRADDGRDVTLPSAYVSDVRDDGLPQLDHGYAVTIHRAQGSTWARTFVLASHDLFREEGYTALSRHREECTVFVTAADVRDLTEGELGSLTRSASRSRAQRLALDIAERAGARGVSPFER